jgi:hypothetical protein
MRRIARGHCLQRINRVRVGNRSALFVVDAAGDGGDYPYDKGNDNERDEI